MVDLSFEAGLAILNKKVVYFRFMIRCLFMAGTFLVTVHRERLTSQQPRKTKETGSVPECCLALVILLFLYLTSNGWRTACGNFGEVIDGKMQINTNSKCVTGPTE